jgi:hypothetical protein
VADFSAMKPLDDIEQAMFLSPETIDPARFAFGSIRAFVKQFITEKRQNS